MYLQEIINLTRSYIDEINESESDWTDQSELVPYVNSEQNFLASSIRKKKQDFFASTSIFALDPSENEYYLPYDCVFPRFVEIIKSGVTGSDPNFVVDEVNADWREIDPSDLRGIKYGLKDRFRRGQLVGENYALWDEKIIFTPVTETVGWCRVWYIRSLPGLHYGTAASAGGSTIGLAASPTKGTLETEVQVYKGMRVGIYSGTGVGQIRRIIDYQPATRVATVEKPWITIPTGGVYSLISPIPPQMHELLSLGAAIRATGKTEDDQNRFVTMYTGMKKTFLDEIDPRNNQGVRRVRKAGFT